MRASNAKGIVVPTIALFSFLILASFGCGPSASTVESGQDSASSQGDRPELTQETIRERINGVYIEEVPDELGVGKPIGWRFFEEEPKEVTVVEKKVEGDRATIILDIKTRSTPRAREPRQLAGQIRTEWELETGWVLRRWRVVDAENISMKYKNLPKPEPTNTNSNR